MAKKVSLMFIPEEEGEVKRIVIAKSTAIYILILLLVTIGFVIFLGYKYISIYTLAKKASMLEEHIEQLQRERDETIDKVVADLSRLIYENQKLLVLLGIEDTSLVYIQGDNLENYIPAIWPTNGWISQNYSEHHKAVDIAAPIGTQIVSTISGYVSAVWIDSLLGNVLEISNKEGFRIVYGHNSSIIVKEGQKINRGDVVSFVGSSGISSGPHLHYEIYYNDSILNPEEYLPSKSGNP